MTVHFERTGGVAGVKLTLALDTASMPRIEAERLQALVEAAAFFDQPRGRRSRASRADRFCYRVTVQETGRAHTLELDEEAIPVRLRPLLDYLTAAAKKR